MIYLQLSSPPSSKCCGSFTFGKHVHVLVVRVYSHSLSACKRLICNTVVVTVTKAHVKADAKPQAPDNFIYIHIFKLQIYNLSIYSNEINILYMQI